MKKSLVAALAATLMSSTAAYAVDMEVTHWWTSGGEAAAVAELAKAWDATGNKWIDNGIAGGGDTARPLIVSRILGGDPPQATQMNNLDAGPRPRRCRSDARSDRRRRSQSLDRHRQPAEAARSVHGRRARLVRADQHSLLAVDVDQPPRL